MMAVKDKIGIDVELLLRWAYVDELSKRQCSAAEGIWDHILDYSNHGGIDSGRGAAQRYAHFGLPDPDAERIERAVSALGETVIDWNEHFETIAGDLAGLISINDLTRRPANQGHVPHADWGAAGTRALKAMFSKDPRAAIPVRERPRDVVMVGGIKTATLVTMHAVKGTRPDCWDMECRPEMVPAAHGRGPVIEGERLRQNYYTSGSCCPLTWSPSPLSIVKNRADYFTWHQGLVRLSETLCLEKFTALRPKASPAPWISDGEVRTMTRTIAVMPNGRNDVGDWGILPLKPQRPKAGPTARQRRDPGRSLLEERG